MTHAPLALRRLDPARDSERLHDWVTRERARFWMMGEHTLEEVREVYTWLDEQPTHHVWFVERDGAPVALFQDYQPAAEEVGEHYDVQPGDLGVHFMMGPIAVPEPGLSAEVAVFAMASAFADPAVQRLVAEPDARNDKAVALFTRLGFSLGERIELSTKPAQLGFLSREVYDVWLASWVSSLANHNRA